MWSTLREIEELRSVTKLCFWQKVGKVGKIYLFYLLLIYLVFIKEHSKSGKKMKLNFSIKMHSIVPFPRIEIRLMQKSAYGIFFSERRK